LSIWQAIILGIIQGLTEFLPVSSSGHLVLLGVLFNIQGDFVFFSVILHFVTLLAVIIYFRKQVWFLIRHPFSPIAKKLILATLPTIVIVLIFKKYIENSFDGALLPFCFVFTAILLLFTQFFATNTQKDVDSKSAFVMGLMQGVAVLPGISRSGSTICTGILMGNGKTQSAQFSFLMSIPIILASMVYELFGFVNAGGGHIFVWPTVVASVFAFVVGLASIKFMMWVVKKVKFYWFSIYLFGLAIICFFVL
jgi:undecaprenyl-diphosphatase